MEKKPNIQFQFMGNCFFRDFIQFTVRMELYEKKFPIYENCMMSNFGQPGHSHTPYKVPSDRFRFSNKSIMAYKHPSINLERFLRRIKSPLTR